MPDALAEVEPKVAYTQVAENTLTTEAEKGKKKSRLMKMVPLSLIKFHAFQKTGKGQAGATPPVVKKTKENLEGPCGLGCMVFPRCQRLNNIHCFLVFYCLLITSQGEPEWGWRSFWGGQPQGAVGLLTWQRRERDWREWGTPWGDPA